MILDRGAVEAAMTLRLAERVRVTTELVRFVPAYCGYVARYIERAGHIRTCAFCEISQPIGSSDYRITHWFCRHFLNTNSDNIAVRTTRTQCLFFEADDYRHATISSTIDRA